MPGAINSIATSPVAGVYTQGPNALCSTCTVCNQGTASIGVGLSAAPGTNIVIVPPNGGQFLFVVTNANQLYVANVSAHGAQEVSFLTGTDDGSGGGAGITLPIRESDVTGLVADLGSE